MNMYRGVAEVRMTDQCRLLFYYLPERRMTISNHPTIVQR